MLNGRHTCAPTGSQSWELVARACRTLLTLLTVSLCNEVGLTAVHVLIALARRGEGRGAQKALSTADLVFLLASMAATVATFCVNLVGAKRVLGRAIVLAGQLRRRVVPQGFAGRPERRCTTEVAGMQLPPADPSR
jgi:hypothetical protein